MFDWNLEVDINQNMFIIQIIKNNTKIMITKNFEIFLSIEIFLFSSELYCFISWQAKNNIEVKKEPEKERYP